MNNKELIEKFYTSFSEGNASEMNACYHKDIVFQDPAFGILKGERAMKMWKMLLSNKKAGLEVTFSNIQTTSNAGSADWVAEYTYGKRKVINKIHAEFKFKEGKISEHTDTFNIWKWSKQALGGIGYVLGWTPFMKNKIQKMTNRKLDYFIKKANAV